MTLLARYRDGRTWQLLRADLPKPDFKSGLCSLWLMQHTVVVEGGTWEGGASAWDTSSRPTREDLARIGSLFGKDASKAVEQKLLWGPS